MSCVFNRTNNIFVGLVGMAACVSSANAQVGRNSTWETETGEIRIFVPDSSTYPRDNWRSGSGSRSDVGELAFVQMQGEYRNLKWKGEYWVMGARDHRPHGSICLGSRPNGFTPVDDSYDYGIFDVTFNAAENSFTGTRQWQCKYPDGRTRQGPVETFNGTRSGITAAMRPTRAVPNGPVSSDPGTGGTPTTPFPERQDCDELRGFIIRADGREIASSPRYFVRPCTIDALSGEKFQIDIINPEGKRPMRLALRGFRLDSLLPNPVSRAITLSGRFTSDTYVQGLPFTGDPARGSAIMNQTMSGRFCNSAIWIAYLDFSDGTQSEPMGALLSKCGARLHPDQLPPLSGPRAGEGEGRRVYPKP